MKKHLTHGEVALLASGLRVAIVKSGYAAAKCYPVPRGGVPVAYAVYHPTECPFVIVNTPEEADFFLDDLIDSGRTMERYCDNYPEKPFFALIDKSAGEYTGEWIVFPWEVTQEEDKSAQDIVVRLLQFIGEDPEREGLLETPRRVLKAWEHWTSGYSKEASDILKSFEDGAENCDEMIVRVVPFYSHCEHHLAPIIGNAVVAYIPDRRIVGLSKIDRVVDMYARRLQVQERMTNNIAQAIQDNLKPKGVAVWINARHLCIESRGVQNQNSFTDTIALRGVFRENNVTRSEFLAVARSKV